jgi:hypothetical protein
MVGYVDGRTVKSTTTTDGDDGKVTISFLGTLVGTSETLTTTGLDHSVGMVTEVGRKVMVVVGGTTTGITNELGTDDGTLVFEITTTLGDDGMVTNDFLEIVDGNKVTEITTGLDHLLGIEIDVKKVTVVVGTVTAGTYQVLG